MPLVLSIYPWLISIGLNKRRCPRKLLCLTDLFYQLCMPLDREQIPFEYERHGMVNSLPHYQLKMLIDWNKVSKS